MKSAWRSEGLYKDQSSVVCRTVLVSCTVQEKTQRTDCNVTDSTVRLPKRHYKSKKRPFPQKDNKMDQCEDLRNYIFLAINEVDLDLLVFEQKMCANLASSRSPMTTVILANLNCKLIRKQQEELPAEWSAKEATADYQDSYL